MVHVESRAPGHPAQSQPAHPEAADSDAAGHTSGGRGRGRGFLRGPAKWALQIVVAGAAAFALYQMAANGLISSLGRAHLPLLVGAFGAVACADLFIAGRWHSLVPGDHRFRSLARIQLESHFWAAVIPGAVAADGYRIVALHRRGTDPHRAAASVMLERGLGAAALVLICGPALAFAAHRVSGRLVGSLSLLAGFLLTMLTVSATAALWTPVRKGRLRWLPARIRHAAGSLEDALADYRNHPRKLVRALVFALGYQGFFAIAYALAGQAVGLPFRPSLWFVAVPLAALAATLPLNALGIGMREGAVVLILVALGVPPAKAAAVSVAVIALQLGLSCSGGISQLIRRLGAARALPAAA